jgi:hypothetical protein
MNANSCSNLPDSTVILKYNIVAPINWDNSECRRVIRNREFKRDRGSLSSVESLDITERGSWLGASPPPPPIVNLDGWAQWPEPQVEGIDENELHLVNDLADAAVANAIADGVMQHPEVPQGW